MQDLNAFKENIVDNINNILSNTLHGDSLRNYQYEKSEFIGTNTEFDDLCGGIQTKQITVIAGASGDGKSLTCLNLALAISNSNLSKNILYFSIENLPETDLGRISSSQFGITDNFNYYNIDWLKCKKYDSIVITLKFLIQNGGYDVVFIDGLQNILPNNDDGMSSYNIGNELMSDLNDIVKNDTKSALVLTWQLTRGTKSKKLSEITIDDISTSMGVTRYASHVYLVKYEPKDEVKNIPATRKLARIKCRTECNPDKWWIYLAQQQTGIKFTLNPKIIDPIYK